MIGLCRLRPVYVIPDDLYPVEVGVLQALAELPFDTRLVLFFRTKSGVNYGFHVMSYFNLISLGTDVVSLSESRSMDNKSSTSS